MMARKRLLLALAVTAVVLAGIGFVVWRELQGNVVRACVASVHQSVISLKDHERFLPDPVGAGWRALGDDQSDRLVSEASRAGSLDCRERASNGLPVDPWGRHFRVAVRREQGDKSLRFMVWSPGRDGRDGTSDDLISPPGVEVPAK